MRKTILDTNIPDLLEPGLDIRFGFYEVTFGYSFQNLSYKVADHKEQRELAEMDQSRPRKRASQELDCKEYFRKTA